jgi:hypothetical protein
MARVSRERRCAVRAGERVDPVAVVPRVTAGVAEVAAAPSAAGASADACACGGPLGIEIVVRLEPGAEFGPEDPWQPARAAIETNSTPARDSLLMLAPNGVFER